MKIRLPDDLKHRIEEAASISKRSLNAEIVARLEASFAVASKMDERSVEHVLTATLTRLSEMEERLASQIERGPSAELTRILDKRRRSLLDPSPDPEITPAEPSQTEDSPTPTVKRIRRTPPKNS